jgi:hypothetical protein
MGVVMLWASVGEVGSPNWKRRQFGTVSTERPNSMLFVYMSGVSSATRSTRIKYFSQPQIQLDVHRGLRVCNETT